MSETRSFDSRYDDEAAIAALVKQGQHRGVIGGLWDEIGSLQFEFLQRHGLLRDHHLLDVGCGSLRGGVHFAAYLQTGHYWGIDANESLLDAGFQIELGKLGLTDRVPRTNLLHDREFSFERFGQTFDAAIAQSLFTHLSANRIRLCLARLAKVMRPGGRLHATYFEVPETHAVDEPYAHANSAPRAQGSDDVRTYAYKDPFHYRLSEMEAFASGLSWRLIWAGDWDHPRSQKMAIFERLAETQAGEKAPNAGVRLMDGDLASTLAPGSEHYRAYVGPPGRFDFLGASQFSLLFTLGLRDRHTVLDFGCGSLRLGRLLIPYLAPDKYFGIDPNRWLIEDGLSRELGWSALRVKRPAFAYNDDFQCNVFGRRFDYIVAQSIVTHCGSGLAQHLLRQMAETLEPSGIAVFTVTEAAGDVPDSAKQGWVYPHCVRYRAESILGWCANAGLTAKRLPWYHPGATWFIAARDPARLPAPDEMAFLCGSVLFDAQCSAARSSIKIGTGRP